MNLKRHEWIYKIELNTKQSHMSDMNEYKQTSVNTKQTKWMIFFFFKK